MTCPEPFRFFYALTAIIHSIFAFMMLDAYVKDTPSDNSVRILFITHLIYRVSLGELQLFTHLELLLTKYSNTAANFFLLQIGIDLNYGKIKYYRYINKCNYAISICMIISIIVLISMWHLDGTPKNYWYYELGSLLVLAPVIIARFIAEKKSRVEQYFYLAGHNEVKIKV